MKDQGKRKHEVLLRTRRVKREDYNDEDRTEKTWRERYLQ
jgi:predicted HTH domain antitoxin